MRLLVAAALPLGVAVAMVLGDGGGRGHEDGLGGGVGGGVAGDVAVSVALAVLGGQLGLMGAELVERLALVVSLQRYDLGLVLVDLVLELG